MGARGPGAQRHYTLYCAPEFRELVYGPDDESPNHVRLMRYRWQNGGESAAREHFREPGRRPWARWKFSCPLRERRKALTFPTEAEAILALGFADQQEREDIFSRGIIERQTSERHGRP